MNYKIGTRYTNQIAFSPEFNSSLDYLQTLRKRLYTDLMRKVAEEMLPGQKYHLQLGDINFDCYDEYIYKMRMQVLLIPVWEFDFTRYTYVKPEPTAKTTLEAGADLVADAILRRIFNGN